ncbi:universal stress protein [Reichenbachiella agarivorans]|uniref:Universal stress protein n=1 Tax=Reichenbachiella agarivorans TaxID=2979464 RepID=A0ABY6CNQ7_9BACT|nr:universal stress protein [Reichenbachiella agarivorans]UXP32156.1 universal stress protein [Reichenbachiella agarivorans]
MNILLATDFTEAAKHAINCIHQITQTWTSRKEIHFTLVHGFKPHVPYSNTPSIPVYYDPSLKSSLQQKLEHEKGSLQFTMQVDTLFEEGPLPLVIESAVKNKKADLIVMGTRQKSAFERVTVGSNTAEVMQKVNTPILAIPLEAKCKQMKSVVLTSDLESINIDHIHFIKKWLQDNHAQLKILHVSDKDKNHETLIKKTAMHHHFSETMHEHHFVYNNDPIAGIQEYIGKEKPDLLIALPRDKNFFQKLFHISVTEDMVYHTQIPILILP